MKYNPIVAPVLKWVGGKRQLFVNCKNFLYKVASQKCTLLQVHFVQCCKLYFVT